MIEKILSKLQILMFSIDSKISILNLYRLGNKIQDIRTYLNKEDNNVNNK